MTKYTAIYCDNGQSVVREKKVLPQPDDNVDESLYGTYKERLSDYNADPIEYPAPFVTPDLNGKDVECRLQWQYQDKQGDWLSCKGSHFHYWKEKKTFPVRTIAVSVIEEKRSIMKTFKELQKVTSGYWDTVKCVCDALGRNKCELNCPEHKDNAAPVEQGEKAFDLPYINHPVEQAEKETPDYFSKEWVGELMKMSKEKLIDLYRRQILYSNRLAAPILQRVEEGNAAPDTFPFVKMPDDRWYYCYKDTKGLNQHSKIFPTYEEAIGILSKHSYTQWLSENEKVRKVSPVAIEELTQSFIIKRRNQ